MNHWPTEKAKLRFHGWAFGSDSDYLPLKPADLLVFEHLNYLTSGVASPPLAEILEKCLVYRIHIDGERAKALTEQLRKLHEDDKNDRKKRLKR